MNQHKRATVVMEQLETKLVVLGDPLKRSPTVAVIVAEAELCPRQSAEVKADADTDARRRGKRCSDLFYLVQLVEIVDVDERTFAEGSREILLGFVRTVEDDLRGRKTQGTAQFVLHPRHHLRPSTLGVQNRAHRRQVVGLHRV